MSLKIAVFDVDGTLVDSRAKIHQVLAEAATVLGHEPPTYDEARQIVGLSLFEAVRAMRPALNDAQVMAYVEAYKAVYIQQVSAGARDVLYDGAQGLLSMLKDGGWLLGMATGNSRRGVDRLCDVFGWGSVFDARFCADDGPSKPHPHMLEANLKHTGTDPHQAVMIGDTSHDILMARAIGVHAIGVSWGFHTVEELRDCGADVIVHDFNELGQALARFEADLWVTE